MRKLISIAALLLLGSCAAASVATTTFDSAGAQKAVFAAKSAYAATLVVAVAYVERPRCGQPESPILCSRTDVVLQLRKADEAASTTIQSAENAVRSLSSSPTVMGAAITAANSAVEAFKTVTAIYAK